MLPDTMQAVLVHQYGGPEMLQIERIPTSEPQAGEVFLRVHAVGVLPADCKVRRGFFKDRGPMQFPYVPSSAVSGVVEAVGPDVTRFQVGDEVFGRATKGASAEYITTAIESPVLNPTLVHKPVTLTFDQAATISGGATSAWWALFDDGNLQANQRVLIQGGAGGVGLFAVQFAKWKGAEVIATTSTNNVEFVSSLGADTVVDYKTTPFEDVVRDVDLVLDTVGGETLHRSMQVVKPGGTLISIVEQPSQKQAAEHGIDAHFSSRLISTNVLETITPLLADGTIQAFVGARFSLENVRQAHELCETGHGRGRIVLHVADW
jgi:NADPH:quinone reductase-like Zn-dependent oxidoreductase